MAAETATITIGLQLTLDGRTYDFTEVTTITNVAQVYPGGEKLVPFAAEIELMKIGAVGVAGELADIDFLIITNKDAVNPCRIRMLDTGAMVYDINLPAGKSHILWTKDINADVAGGAWAAWTSIDTIKAQFTVADGFIHMFAAKKQ